MADPNDNTPADQPDPDPDPGPDPVEVPVEGDDAPQVEEPRRLASARFEVDTQVGSQAAMREAMDPANQSLADALRLSFRVLQVVIGVLVVLFVFSGWKQVKEGQTGVLSVWGRIVEYGEEKALVPGLKFSKWPYPAGEFILFQETDRPVRLDQAFWPRLGNVTLEKATEAATVADRLKPGRDGSVLTLGGDLAHLQLSANYEIVLPEPYVELIDDAQATTIVRLALERAVVHVAAKSRLEDLIDRDAAVASDVQQSAQEVLDGMRSGIRLRAVSLPRTTAPLAIRKTLQDLQKATVDRDETKEKAREMANAELTAMAGKDHPKLVTLIEAYEEALLAEDDALSRERLDAVNAQLDDPGASGQVATIIQRAKNYTSEVELTLGHDARRFTSLLPQYRENPQRLVKQLWFETFARVLAMEDAEIYFVPSSLETVHIKLTGLDEVQRLRLQKDLEQREIANKMQFRGSRTLRARDHTMQGAGRTLAIDPETGEIISKGRR